MDKTLNSYKNILNKTQSLTFELFPVLVRGLEESVVVVDLLEGMSPQIVHPHQWSGQVLQGTRRGLTQHLISTLGQFGHLCISLLHLTT